MNQKDAKNIAAMDSGGTNQLPRASQKNGPQGTGRGFGGSTPSNHENIGVGPDHLGGMGANQRPFHADKLTPNVGGYNNPQESGRGENDSDDANDPNPRNAGSEWDNKTFSQSRNR